MYATGVTIYAWICVLNMSTCCLQLCVNVYCYVQVSVAILAQDRTICGYGLGQTSAILSARSLPEPAFARLQTSDVYPAEIHQQWHSDAQLRQVEEDTVRGGDPTCGKNGGVGFVPHRIGQAGRSVETRDVKDGHRRAGTLNLGEKVHLGARATRTNQESTCHNKERVTKERWWILMARTSPTRRRSSRASWMPWTGPRGLWGISTVMKR